jgi:hypothetical protein
MNTGINFLNGDGISVSGAGSTAAEKKVTVSVNFAAPSYSTTYNQFIQPVAGSRRALVIKSDTYIRLDIPEEPGEYFVWGLRQDMSIPDVTAILDTGSALAAGKDYFVYLVLSKGNDSASVKVSLNTTAPNGETAYNSRKIGGFHAICASAGTGRNYTRGGQTVAHELNGWLAGDILPLSIWDLKHRPRQDRTPQPGMVYEKYLGFWVDIYSQSGTGLSAMSAYQGTIARSRQYVDFVEDMFCAGKILLDDEEFAAAAIGSPEQLAVNGATEAAATSGGAGGRTATNGARILSYCGCEEMVGCLRQWLRSTSAGGGGGSIHGQTDATPTYGWITQSASAHGPCGQAGGKGSFWALAGALVAGGAWGDTSTCGSRARDAGSARSYAATYIGGRGRARGAE